MTPVHDVIEDGAGLKHVVGTSKTGGKGRPPSVDHLTLHPRTWPNPDISPTSGEKMGIHNGEAHRDWPLMTGRVGYKTGGAACEVLPLRKGGWWGGGGSSHIEGGRNNFPIFKRGEGARFTLS